MSAPVVEQDRMLSVAEVIDHLSISRATFYRWRSIGRGPRSLRLPNGEIRIWRSVLEQWLRALEEAG
jgi:predicted DNA-binding transcriptional regulator AlpA